MEDRDLESLLDQLYALADVCCVEVLKGVQSEERNHYSDDVAFKLFNRPAGASMAKPMAVQ